MTIQHDPWLTGVVVLVARDLIGNCDTDKGRQIAESHLLLPKFWMQLRDLGVDPELIRILEHAAQIEDLCLMAPEELPGAILRHERSLSDLLTRLPPRREPTLACREEKIDILSMICTGCDDDAPPLPRGTRRRLLIAMGMLRRVARDDPDS